MFAHAFYREIEGKLFKNCDYDDFVHFFMELMFSTYSRTARLGFAPRLLHGRKLETSIRLKPSPGVVKRNGCEFCTSVLEFYNKEYWLIKLWIAMYVDAKGSKIGREIVRAFIINCISVTARELVHSGVKDISSDTLNGSYISDRAKFYRKIFNGRAIWKRIRLKQRKDIKRKYDRRGASVRTVNMECIESDVTMTALTTLLRDNGMEEYVPLAEISHRQKNAPGITEPMSYLLFFMENLSGKKKIKKQISRLVSECRL